MSSFQIEEIGKAAKLAARSLRSATGASKSVALLNIALELDKQREFLKSENQKDLDQAIANGLSPALVDRLKLSDKAIDIMISGLEQIAAMPDPIGSISQTNNRPNGMQVARMRMPLGVIGIIYESRPNVTIDAAALCLKSGNACILRGGSESIHSNLALKEIIQKALLDANLDKNSVQVISTTDRSAVGQMITATDYIDVIIPRGGKGLITRLSEEATVPLIKHLDGNCHIYVDSAADLEKASAITINAKTYRPGICGAVETLLVHQDVASAWLPLIGAKLNELGVELRADERAIKLLPQAKPANAADWSTEYLAPILAVAVVDSLDQALDHIAKYTSEHTESIVTENISTARRFQREVDSSSVYINLPTCFADGFEYGLGAEIGISTNRLHARGPVGLEGLTIEKWVLTGDGQLRS